MPLNSSESDCLIVGAGPVGLSLALGLARQGLRVVVVEKADSTAEFSRAPAIWPATQEVLNRLDIAQTLLDAGIHMPRLELLDADSGRILLSAPVEELKGETDFPQLLILPQSETERLLLRALRSHDSATVLFGTELCELQDSGDEVTALCKNQDGELQLRAGVVAGCDGAHSRVRELLGLGFEGQTFPFKAALADVSLSKNGGHSPRLTTKGQLAIGIRISETTWRLILPFSDRDVSPLPDRIRETVATLFDSPYELLWQSEFSLHDLVATGFAKGRIVLAGDAAHLNSPVGGQGMNAGIQDTEPLVKAIARTLKENDPAPLQRYASLRQRRVSTGVNRFTTLLTRLLMIGQGRHLKLVLRAANAMMRITPLRRRILRKLAMLDSRDNA